MHPLVSVIIPTFNQSAYLVQAIGSVLAQTYAAVEVIVIDDGSTDDTPQAVASFGTHVRYFRQDNRGTAAARNAGIAQARGSLIAFLDHDDLWEPQKLQLQAPMFAADPALGLVYSAIRFFDDKTGRVTAEHFPGDNLSFHDLLGHEIISLQSSVIPKAALDAIGGFDKSLFGADDWDLCIRLTARYGARGVNVPLVNIRLHSAHASSAAERLYQNEWAVLRKNSKHHTNCPACRAAIRQTRRTLRAAQYNRRCSRAKSEFGQGKIVAALATRCRAVLNYPVAVGRLPRRVAEAVGWMPS